MGSIRGFRCRRCRTEVLADRGHGRVGGRPEEASPVLCCGWPVRPLDTGLVLSAPVPRLRVAQCPRCAYQVRVIVQPSGLLVCAFCQREFVIAGESRLGRGGETHSRPRLPPSGNDSGQT